MTPLTELRGETRICQIVAQSSRVEISRCRCESRGPSEQGPRRWEGEKIASSPFICTKRTGCVCLLCAIFKNVPRKDAQGIRKDLEDRGGNAFWCRRGDRFKRRIIGSEYFEGLIEVLRSCNGWDRVHMRLRRANNEDAVTKNKGREI